MKHFLLLIGGFLMLAAFCPCLAQKKDKRTPFAAVKFMDDHPWIQYQGEWVKFLGMGGHPWEIYIQKALEDELDDWQRGFVRYNHYYMDELGIKRGDSLAVRFEQRGKVKTALFPLSRENRENATQFLYETFIHQRISRDHSQARNPKWNYLQTRLDGYTKNGEAWLSYEEALWDLEHLEWQIQKHYSYADLRGFDYPKALDAIIQDLREGISKRDLALQLKLFMANFGDGHSRVSQRLLLKEEADRFGLPFRIIKQQGKYYASNPAKKDFYLPAYPQILSIQGLPIEQLYQVAEQFAPKTTARFVEANSLKYLSHYTAMILRMAGQELPEDDQITVRFGNKEKNQEKTITLKRYRLPSAPERHYYKKEILEGNIGYLAINEHMNGAETFVDSLHAAMQSFQATDGLIIDIRDNGGGNRAPLIALLSYLIQKPVVTNTARFRIDYQLVKPKSGFLERRYAYFEDYEGYSATEKETIIQFKKQFKPRREVPEDKFSDYHYMLVNPIAQEKGYYYDKPVIVLIDEGCFSASDIFAAGIQQGDRVKLLGNRTGGGSGYSDKKTLPNSEIDVRLSSIYSYQPNGKLYDGQGVAPDIPMDYSLSDRLGQSDGQLDKALAILKISSGQGRAVKNRK